MGRAALAAFAVWFSLCVEAQARDDRPAPLLAAFDAAYRDFTKRIMSKDDGTDLGRHQADITNYRLTIYQKDKRFIVEITPLPLHGVTLRGGGARYEVDANSAAILAFEPYK